jgi:hypothetical protein
MNDPDIILLHIQFPRDKRQGRGYYRVLERAENAHHAESCHDNPEAYTLLWWCSHFLRFTLITNFSGCLTLLEVFRCAFRAWTKHVLV